MLTMQNNFTKTKQIDLKNRLRCTPRYHKIKHVFGCPATFGLYSHIRWLEVKEVEGLFQLCSENKDTEQLICVAKPRFVHDAAHKVFGRRN